MHFFSAHTIFISAPFEQDGSWLFLFGDETKYKFEVFETLGGAECKIKAIKCALSLGAGYISYRIHDIEAAQVRKITDLFSYRQVVARLL